jgi:hypothetical protein
MSDGGFREVNGAVADTGDMSAVLSSQSKPKPEQNFVGAPKDKKEAETKAREHGYTVPVPYDYSAYQDDGKGSDMLASATRAAAAQAVRYEWKGEYGEVGPKIPELEAILFSDEFKYEAGTQRDRIEDFKTEITSNSDLKFVAITNVSTSQLFVVITSNLKNSSKRLVSIQCSWRHWRLCTTISLRQSRLPPFPRSSTAKILSRPLRPVLARPRLTLSQSFHF